MNFKDSSSSVESYISSSSDETNSYLNHIEQNEWNDIQAYHIENASAWRNIAILAIIALSLIAAYAMYIASQDKHKTLIFEKDSNGNITTLGLASTSFNIDNKMIAHELVNFIMALREVPADIVFKRRNIDLVHKMISPKIQPPIDQMIIDQYNLANGGEITVNVNQIKPLDNTGSNWDISWSETLTTGNGANISTTSWSSIINFKRLTTIPLDIQIVNPIGIFVTSVHPVQDINEKGF
jgi:type IV secretory pathway TrbF-like protein